MAAKSSLVILFALVIHTAPTVTPDTELAAKQLSVSENFTEGAVTKETPAMFQRPDCGRCVFSWWPLAYFYRRLANTQQKYSPFYRELLAFSDIVY